MKKHTHTFTMTVRFDKKCTKAHALREIRNSGEIFADTHYCNWVDYEWNAAGTDTKPVDPETYKVKSVR